MTTDTQATTWTAVPSGGGAAIKDEHGGYIATVQWRGNASLVAAAPELLSALERAATSLALAAEMMRAKGLDGAGASLELDASRAQNVIAKAQGTA